ncbi:prefoldin subunit 4 [Parasteatoda tepidariorum]|nr:prefoldin subunit 4-like [Parasteatoda tepidariorum]
MAASVDSDLHVSFEDQQKINKFARHNSRLDDIMDELKAKENELQALEDAESELLMCADEEKTPFRIGDVFVFVTMDQAQEMLADKKESISEEAKVLKEQQESIKQTMSDLKVQLYAKFGNNINLEPE